jgi:MFS family permease
MIADSIGWRWAFAIQLPMIMMALISITQRMKIPAHVHAHSSSLTTKEKIKQIDFLGSGLLISISTLFILGMTLGGNVVPWLHPFPIASLALCAILLVAFLVQESHTFVVVNGVKKSNAIFPVYLMKQRTPLSTSLTNWLSSMVAFSIIFNLPLFYQVVFGVTASQAGIRLLPFTISSSIGSLLAGITMGRTGKYYWLGVTSFITITLGAALCSTLDENSAVWRHFVYVIPNGLGFGACLTVVLIALISSVPASEQAAVTGMSYLFRSTGSVIGITMTQSLIQNLLNTYLHERIKGDNADWIISQVRKSIQSIYNPNIVRIEYRPVIIKSYVQAIHHAFYLSTGWGVLSIVAGLIMREHELPSTIDRSRVRRASQASGSM